MGIKTIKAVTLSGSILYQRAVRPRRWRRAWEPAGLVICCDGVIHEYFGALRPYTKYEVYISKSPPKRDSNYLTISRNGFPHTHVHVEGKKTATTFYQDYILNTLFEKWQCNTVYAWLYEVIDEGEM